MQFWKDKLCGDEVLCTTLPSLYVIVDFKEDWVKNVWHTTVEGNYWAHRFSRLLNDWDLDLIERFLLSFQVRFGRQLLSVYFGQFGRKEIG